MKIFLLAAALLYSNFFLMAQTMDSSAVPTKDCYEEYKAAFTKKGSYMLKDGLYNTIITIRHNGECKTYDGQARIVAGKFVLPLYIKTDEGKFIPLKDTGRKLNKNYDAYKLPLENKVVNGCSPTYISDDDELIDIFIIDLLKQSEK